MWAAQRVFAWKKKKKKMNFLNNNIINNTKAESVDKTNGFAF